MQQKLRVLHETFFTGKIVRKFYGTYVGPVSLLFLLKLTRSFTEKWKKVIFLHVIRSNAPPDVHFKADVVKKKKNYHFQ